MPFMTRMTTNYSKPRHMQYMLLEFSYRKRTLAVILYSFSTHTFFVGRIPDDFLGNVNMKISCVFIEFYWYLKGLIMLFR